jgi:xylan 1,4-beta-xylosidase
MKHRIALLLLFFISNYRIAQQEPNADGYVIYFGKSHDKLYDSIMVYSKNEYYFNGLDKSDVYYFQINAFNNNGIGL